MKRIGITGVILTVLFMLCIPVQALGASDVIRFADPVLEARVREQIGRPEGEITAADVENITYLDISSKDGELKKITDLSGIEAFENLETLAVFNNDVEDITPLAALTKLRDLDLGGNRVSDLSPLQNLHMQRLVLWGNEITDISPLEGMGSLMVLYLSDNHISNLYPIAGLTGLNDLSLDMNEITDITPLSGMHDLQHLSIGANQISDLTPLAGLHLTELYLLVNQISDITPLAQMGTLERLDLVNNQVSDISALAGKTKLNYLWLNGNQITDYSPVADIFDGIADKDFELDPRTVMIMRGENPDEVIIFDDPVLLDMLRKALNVSGDITVAMAAGVRELHLELGGDDRSTPRISNLNGLQYFVNLVTLELGYALDAGEAQVDLTPLSALTKLEQLRVQGDRLRDIGWLSELTNLRYLWIWNNEISDISALSNMTQMENIWIFNNRISDIGVLANMPNLYCVQMAYNQVMDLSPLAGLTRLETLEVSNNPVFDYHVLDGIYPQLAQKDFDINTVTGYNMPENPDAVVTFADPLLERKVREQMNIPQGDITALDAAKVTSLSFNLDWREDLTEDDFIFSLDGLQYFINLKSLSMYQNAISDLTPLAGLTSLENLDFGSNGVSDLTPIQNLTHLKTLTFYNNNVEDISVLVNFPELKNLSMKNNPIADYTPIQDLYATYESTDFEYGEKFERKYEPENAGAVVVFPDKVLEKRIRGTIGKQEGDILVGDLAFLEDLWIGTEWQETYAEGDRITDLTGLENCLNLKNLDLRNSDLSDLSPLSGMIKLETLNLVNCGIEDITPLGSLTTLLWLDIGYNNITDISALSSLTKLTGLYLDGNGIIDHTPIQAIYENLEDRDFEYGDVVLLPEDPDVIVVFADPLFERLLREQTGLPDGPITARQAAQVQRLDFNLQWQETIPDDIRIHDLTGIEYFINLQELSLNFHAVSDISMLPALTQLRTLDIGANGMSDLSVLASMTNLRRLVLFANGIEDISPLSGLTGLEYLQLEHNRISDLTPLAGMTELETLWLTDNPIEDYSPIQDIVPHLTDKDF